MKCLINVKGCCGPVPQRYVTVVMSALGLAFVFILRNFFSLALTQMSKTSENNKANNGEEGLNCPVEEKSLKVNTEEGEFAWDSHDAQLLISAYFYGYILAHIPGGVIGDFVGAKVVLNTGLFVGGLCALLTPVSARLHFWVLFVVRVVMGLGHGVIFPALSALVAMWAPPNERGFMSAITYSGIMLGSAAGISLTGVILGILPGWEPPFYIFGGLMMVWCLAFYILGYSSPDKHPFVTDKERDMVIQAIHTTTRKKPKLIPWSRIFLSPSVLSLILITTGHSWMIFFIGVQLPLYVKQVLHYDIMGSGFSAAMPYLGMWITAVTSGFISDWTNRAKLISPTNARKTFALLSNMIPIPFFLSASFAGCDKDLATALFTITMFFKGLAYCSIMANCVDLSPNYAGLLMGLANGGSAVGGLLIPYTVDWFLPRNKEASIYDWRKVFFFSVGVLICLSLPYLFFGSAKVQPWNNAGIEKDEDETSAPSPQPAK